MQNVKVGDAIIHIWDKQQKPHGNKLFFPSCLWTWNSIWNHKGNKTRWQQTAGATRGPCQCCWKCCMAYSLDSNLRDRPPSLVFTTLPQRNSRCSGSSRQMGKMDGRGGRKGELCTSNAIPASSKEERRVGDSHATILRWLFRNWIFF